MKKIFAILALTIISALGISAQASKNEGYVGYSFLRQNVQYNVTPVLKFDTNTDSNGITFGGAHYITKNLGLTADATINGGSNSASLVTVMVGGIAKARNLNFVQPYVRVLAGVGRQNVTRSNIKDFTDVQPVVDAGAGVDLYPKKGGKVGLRLGADLVNSGFNGNRTNSARLTAALVF